MKSKINWDAVTAIATSLAAVATSIAVVVYFYQTSLINLNLRNAQASAEAQFYLSIQSAVNELYKKQTIGDYYGSMLDPTSPGANLNYPEIREYLDMLEITASLHNTGKIDKDNFAVLYGERIKDAAKFVENVNKTRLYNDDLYKNIVTLAQSLESDDTNHLEEREEIFPLKWSYIWAGLFAFAASAILNLYQYCALCRLKRPEMQPETPPQ